ncbi:hypothetical protein [Halalkalibacter oceani]|uniref:hypothetical protein n=1 Tax=Halalkalibacter oceani TaxID=1653776 RepID=UPI00339923C2
MIHIPVLGFSAYGYNTEYESPTSPVRDFYYGEMNHAIFDEIHIRERVDVPFTSQKNTWQLDTRLLGTFKDTLEMGNIFASGLEIVDIIIKRREITETVDTVLDVIPFKNDERMVWTDHTQGNRTYIYSIVPRAENGLEAKPNSVEITSDFVGYYLIDHDGIGNPNENHVVAFNQSLESSLQFALQLNQGRTELETMTKYRRVFYTSESYHTFQLQGAFIPEEWERSGQMYERFLNNMIYKHKPLIIKGSDGLLFVADIHSPQREVPQNAYTGYDYYTLTVSGMESYDYKQFLEDNSGLERSES